jgi:hypothetical protein
MNETLIVRLAGNRGQIAVRKDSEAMLRALNDLDNQVVALLERSQADLRHLLEEMSERVELAGEPVKNELVKSDLILPPVDLTLAEATRLFVGEGILPG